MYLQFSFNVAMLRCTPWILLHQTTFPQIILGLNMMVINCLASDSLQFDRSFKNSDVPDGKMKGFIGAASRAQAMVTHMESLPLGISVGLKGLRPTLCYEALS